MPMNSVPHHTANKLLVNAIAILASLTAMLMRIKQLFCFFFGKKSRCHDCITYSSIPVGIQIISKLLMTHFKAMKM